jgi:hypothetical protein
LFAEILGAPKKKDWAALKFHLRLSLPRVVMDMVNNPATSKAATAEWTPAAPISEMHQFFLRGDSEKRIGADCNFDDELLLLRFKKSLKIYLCRCFFRGHALKRWRQRPGRQRAEGFNQLARWSRRSGRG